MMNARDVFYLSPEKEVAEDTSATPESAITRASELLSRSAGEKPSRERPVECSFSHPSLSPLLGSSLSNLADLVANITESYSAVIFVALRGENALVVGGSHTLSREFDHTAKIGFGQGLVGWTAENKKRISVSPFQHDATTLLYYHKDQALKSFVAMPILGEANELLGVVCCDSKKTYAFAKVTEKLLLDCAKQAATLIGLNHRLEEQKQEPAFNHSKLQEVLDKLRNCDTEDELLSLVAKIPADLIERDALVVMSTAQGGVGKGVFYSVSPHSGIEHRLLELVCRHKKVLCAERSVHALPSNDMQQRSFLSIPFHAMGREAGSLNLLSKPHQSFSGALISTLESIATVVGRELERVRLRERFVSSAETNGILSWNNFAIRANALLGDAKSNRVPLSLVRFSINNLQEIEDLAGVEVALGVTQKVMRLVEQVKRASAIACYLYGSQILLLTESAQAERTVVRLEGLIKRLTSGDISARAAQVPRLGSIIAEGVTAVIAESPRDGETLAELTSKTARNLELQLRHKSTEARAHAGNWS